MFPAWICIAILWLTYGKFKQSNIVAGKTAIIVISKYQEIENDVCFFRWNEGFCRTERLELSSRQIAMFMPWNPKNMAALKKEKNSESHLHNIQGWGKIFPVNPPLFFAWNAVFQPVYSVNPALPDASILSWNHDAVIDVGFVVPRRGVSEWRWVILSMDIVHISTTPIILATLFWSGKGNIRTPL